MYGEMECTMRLVFQCALIGNNLVGKQELFCHKSVHCAITLVDLLPCIVESPERKLALARERERERERD